MCRKDWLKRYVPSARLSVSWADLRAIWYRPKSLGRDWAWICRCLLCLLPWLFMQDLIQDFIETAGTFRTLFPSYEMRLIGAATKLFDESVPSLCICCAELCWWVVCIWAVGWFMLLFLEGGEGFCRHLIQNVGLYSLGSTFMCITYTSCARLWPIFLLFGYVCLQILWKHPKVTAAGRPRFVCNRTDVCFWYVVFCAGDKS